MRSGAAATRSDRIAVPCLLWVERPTDRVSGLFSSAYSTLLYAQSCLRFHAETHQRSQLLRPSTVGVSVSIYAGLARLDDDKR